MGGGAAATQVSAWIKAFCFWSALTFPLQLKDKIIPSHGEPVGNLQQLLRWEGVNCCFGTDGTW